MGSFRVGLSRRSVVSLSRCLGSLLRLAARRGKVRNPEFLSTVASICKKDDYLVVGCNSGGRSLLACIDLLGAGFEHVTNVEGGYSAWVDSGLAGDKPAEELKTFCRKNCCCKAAVKVHLLVGLLNVDGYYDSLLELFDKCRELIQRMEEGFINTSARNIVISAKTAREQIQRMEDYIPVHEHVTSSQSWNAEECNVDF